MDRKSLTDNGSVADIICYPVKGCAGVSLRTASMTFRGLEHDREFMIVGADGSFRSQRSDPVLAVVHPSIVDDVLTLSHDSFGSIAVEVNRHSQRRDVTMFGEPFHGIDQGDDVARWIGEILGEECRLVRITSTAPSFADSTAVHILSDASMHGLNARLDAPIPFGRFRPNIVVTGWADAHREDQVRLASVGTCELAFDKIAIRCAVTTVEQTTGIRTGPEPLRTLAAYRRGPTKGVVFGAKFSVNTVGRVSVGDEFTVLEEESFGLDH